MQGYSATLVSLGDAPDIRLDVPIVLVGRSADCDVVIDSRKVSRKHCCIAQLRDCLIVRDLGSTNGVRVNGQRTDEGRVREGDELAIANLRYRYQRGTVPARPPGGHMVRPAAVSDSVLENADGPIPLADDDAEDVPMHPSDEPPIHTGLPLVTSGTPVPGDHHSWLNVPDEVPLAPASDMDLPFTPPHGR